MSLLNDIMNVAGFRTAASGSASSTNAPAGQATGSSSAAASTLHQRLGSTFSSTFNRTLSTVYERGTAGDFEDRTLALEEQAALQRLLAAQKAANSSGTVSGGGPVVGANAAPDVSVGASSSDTILAEQREVYAVRIRQSEARLTKVSASLEQEYPKAAQLVSASTGTWDPATFVPKSEEQAEAFAQRLVIDVTEAAARLEILKNQLDSARLELANGGGADVQAQVAALEAAYDRQTAYVDKLARIVDRQSSGMMSDAGTDAMSGNTMRGDGDIPVDEIVVALRAEGYTDEQIARVVGATEVGVEEEKTPGGSTRLQTMSTELTKTFLARFNEMKQRHEQERKQAEEKRQEQQRIDDKRIARKRADEKAADKSVERRRNCERANEQASAQRAANRDAQFQQWMQRVAAEHAQRDRAIRAS